MELRRYWQIIRKRWVFLLSIVIAIVASAVVLSLIVTPVYMFHSSVWIRPSDATATIVNSSLNDLAALGIIDSDLVMYSQLSLSKHSDLIQKVINSLGLKKKNGKSFAIPEFMDASTFSIVINKSGVRSRVIQNTQLIQIEGFSSSPQTAAAIANQVAAGYADLCTQLIKEKAENVHRFIREQIPKVSATLRNAEEQLRDYRMKNHLSDITYFREQLLSSLSDLKDTRNLNARQIVELDQRIAQVRRKLNEIPEYVQANTEYESNPTLSYLREKIMDAEADFAKLKVRLTEEHTATEEIKKTLEKLKQEYKKQVTRIFSTETTSRNQYFDDLVRTLGDNEIELVALSVQSDLLLNQIESRQTELDQLTQKEMSMEPLERKVTTMREALEDLMNQEQIARLAGEMSLTPATVIELAAVPTEKDHLKLYRWFPKRRLLVSMAFLISLLLGLAVILLQEYLDDTFDSAEEAEAFLQTSVVATLPNLLVGKELTVAQLMSRRSWSQTIWNLALFLQKEGQETPLIVAVTSTQTGEGKSVVTGALGQAFASRGSRVLLVDANFSRPGLERLWQLQEESGLQAVVTGSASLQESIRQIGSDQLYLLAAGKPLPEAPPNVDDPYVLSSLLSTVMSSYDVILLDLESIEGSRGAALASIAQQVILVVAANRTSRLRVRRAMELCNRFGGSIKGLVVNRIEDDRSNFDLRAIYNKLRS